MTIRHQAVEIFFVYRFGIDIGTAPEATVPVLFQQVHSRNLPVNVPATGYLFVHSAMTKLGLP